VVHFPWALSHAEGESELELSDDNSGNHRLRQTTKPGAFREERRPTVSVTAKTLDQVFATEPGLSKEDISVIWLDIEGHEGHFFMGAQKVLNAEIPVVAEFWPYALNRSGMSPLQYCRIVSDLFTNFYVLSGKHFEKHGISDINGLFDVYKAPREMCQIVLVRDQ
jgi:FkbM family methyltransferase